MLIDAEQWPAGLVKQAEVCVVGAGAAGISLALSLATAGISVLVLESGGFGGDRRRQALYRGQVADERLHSPPDKYRQRCFGGSTTIWGGRCMPFDPWDFETRDWAPDSGWPIGYADVASYYPAANAMVEAGACVYDADAAFDPSEEALIRGFASDSVLTSSLERFSCPTDFGKRYRRRLASEANIEVMLNANCLDIALSTDGGSVASLAVGVLSGKIFAVKARYYVLGVGGIETARLLLASNSVCRAGVGNDYDQVGRYYMTHLGGVIGELTIQRPLRDVRHGYLIAADGVYCRRRLSLSADAQRRLGVGNMLARLHFPPIADPKHGLGVLSALFLARRLISYEYAYRLRGGAEPGWRDYAAHARNVAVDALDITQFGWHWLTRRTLAERKYPSVVLRNKQNRFSLDVHSEQFPNPNSRISLCGERDEFGMPRVLVDWRYLPEDIESVRRTLRVFAAEFARGGVGVYRFEEDELEAELTRFGAYGGHHIGTARMGDNVKKSVTDKNCRVHGQSNLYVAGSAVFPTSSQANPTLTLVALSLRLAAHLAELLKTPGGLR